MARDLIIKVCDDCGKPKKADGLIEKYLNDTKKLEIPKVLKNKSSFMFFCEDYRDKVKKKYPSDGMVETNKKLDKLWKKISEKDKLKYVKMAEKDKQRYKKEISKSQPKLSGLLTSDRTLEISCIKDDLYDNSDSDSSSEDLDDSSEEDLDDSNSNISNSDVSDSDISDNDVSDNDVSDNVSDNDVGNVSNSDSDSDDKDDSFDLDDSD